MAKKSKKYSGDDVQIIHDGDHYVAYVDGELYCTADTYREAVQELGKDGIFV